MPPPPGGGFGAFDGDRLVGIGSLSVVPKAKLRHKGHVAAVYVDPAYRRGGTARALMEALIEAARDSGLDGLRLMVTVGNEAAVALYRSLGFTVYGTEERGLQVDGVYFDDLLMALELRT
jgi:ribosomal protein S18 acetylase RimI-like enzyme